MQVISQPQMNSYCVESHWVAHFSESLKRWTRYLELCVPLSVHEVRQTVYEPDLYVCMSGSHCSTICRCLAG